MTMEELLRSAFLRYLQSENECYAGITGKPCSVEKCACDMELQHYIDVERELNQQLKPGAQGDRP
jgi:hypothetical protein